MAPIVPRPTKPRTLPTPGTAYAWALLHHACPDALEWLRTQGTLEEAWLACPRGTWMTWALRRARVPWVLYHLARGACMPGHRQTDQEEADAIRQVIPTWPGGCDEQG